MHFFTQEDSCYGLIIKDAQFSGYEPLLFNLSEKEDNGFIFGYAP